MMRKQTRTAVLLVGCWLGAAGSSDAQLILTSGYHPPPAVELWLEGGRDAYAPGEALRLRMRSSERAWVAVVHVDPAGRMEFLLPTGPGDDHYLFPGRSYTLPRGSATAAWRLGPARGIGYFFVVASREPLEMRRFQRGARFAGGQVRGDPFLVMHEVAEALRPRTGTYALEAISYRVGSGELWPSYACWDRSPLSGSFLFDTGYLRCDRLPMLLAMESRYYDPVRFRGDRGQLFGRLAQPTPRSKQGASPAPAARPAPAPAPVREDRQPRARPESKDAREGERAGRGRPAPP
jgi:hypothetical protein